MSILRSTTGLITQYVIGVYVTIHVKRVTFVLSKQLSTEVIKTLGVLSLNL